MTWIKICGTTNLEDARMAVDAGADALGFVFHEKSPRKIDPKAARQIVAELPANVEKVGVFVDQRIEHIREVVQRVRLTAVQVYAEPYSGHTTDIFALKEGGDNPKLILVYPAAKLMESGSLFISDYVKGMLYALMLDSSSGLRPGGTGKTFDWDKARGLLGGADLRVPLIVAGGLNPLNVSEALNLFQPYGVDVATGVEAKPGKKDPDKVRRFIQAVRDTEKSA